VDYEKRKEKGGQKSGLLTQKNDLPEPNYFSEVPALGMQNGTVLPKKGYKQ
jgi:hypothetical protein